MLINVDFEALMEFGKTYRTLGDSLDHRKRHQLAFSAAPVQQVINAYDLDLRTTNSHFRGKTMHGIQEDAVARADRVAHYLKSCSSDLFRHAGALHQIDNRFNWSSAALGAAWTIGAGLDSFADGSAATIVEWADPVVGVLDDVLGLVPDQWVSTLWSGVMLPFNIGDYLEALDTVKHNIWGGLLDGTMAIIGIGSGLVAIAQGASTFFGIAAIGAPTLAAAVAAAAPYLAVAAAGIAAFKLSSWLTRDFGNWLGGAMYDAWQWTTDALGTAKDALTGFGKHAWSLAGDVWDGTVDFGADVWNSAVDFGGNVWDSAIDFGGNVWDSTVDFGGGVWNRLFGSDGVVNEYWDRARDSINIINGTLGGPLIGAFGPSVGLGSLDGWFGADRYRYVGPTGEDLQHLESHSVSARADAWNSLGASEQRRLIQLRSAAIGNMDGLPVDVRFAANRETIRQALEAARLAGDVEEIRHLEALNRDGRTFLMLDLNAEGGGRIAEVHGDLTNSHNVVVVVPGINNDISHFSDPPPEHLLVDGSRHIFEEAGSNTAVIAWLDYDAPDQIDGATTNEDRARDGAVNLQHFVATHTDSSQNVTVVGHSYGSTTAGIAATEGMENVDNLVLLGSPGGGADHSSNYRIDPRGRTFAASAPGDPVSYGPTSGSVDIAVGVGGTILAGPLGGFIAVTAVDYDPLGKDPTSDDFGATVLDADHLGSSHGDYLDKGDLLDDIIRVTIEEPPGATDLDYSTFA
ncbi:MAG: hypothetical protein DHS20C19_12200 [Acidimicrobiales bacterium]|nr:MAG: hypothetical protein DHS20C19_12200 [Acidimicrobiales bacterium]